MIDWMTDRFQLLRPLAYQLVLWASSVLSIFVWLGVAACLLALLAELTPSSESPSQSSTS